jgi:hypothetical protein
MSWMPDFVQPPSITTERYKDHRFPAEISSHGLWTKDTLRSMAKPRIPEKVQATPAHCSMRTQSELNSMDHDVGHPGSLEARHKYPAQENSVVPTRLCYNLYLIYFFYALKYFYGR